MSWWDEEPHPVAKTLSRLFFTLRQAAGESIVRMFCPASSPPGNPDMVGLIRGNQFDQRPVAIEHGQHVGYRIENLTGITLPEPAPGTLRRIELCFELFDPAEKLLTGTVIVSAHTL